MVAADGSEGIYRLSALDTTRTLPGGRVGLPGLDPARRYAVSPVPVSLPDGDRPVPAWFGGVTLDGRTLEHVGLMAPYLDVDDCILVRVVATA